MLIIEIPINILTYFPLSKLPKDLIAVLSYIVASSWPATDAEFHTRIHLHCFH